MPTENHPRIAHCLHCAAIGFVLLFRGTVASADEPSTPASTHGSRFKRISPLCRRAEKDGASVLWKREIVLRGEKGATLCRTDGDPQGARPSIRLEGAWRLSAGESPVTVLLGAVPATLQQVDIVAVVEKERTSLLVLNRSENGEVKLSADNNPHGQILRQGVPYQCTKTRCDVSPKSGPALRRLQRKLTPKPSEPLLALDDPARPADRTLPGNGTENADENIEIEAVEIEIEPGCIEVCQD